jgi:hypothetical protein
VITVFIGTTDRLGTLSRTVASYHNFTTPHRLVIVDNGTKHRECQRLLHVLERTRVVERVYRLPACDNMEEATENFNIAIRDQYDSGDAGEWFAVSEADVCFAGSDPGSLNAYIAVAQATGKPAGPHLRVDANIPSEYPLRSRVLACETWMLYRRDMEWLLSRELGRRSRRVTNIPFSRTQIDTTFHLFPATRRFDRLRMDPMRVGPPFTAMHLDWYVDPFKPTPENPIYINGERKVGSWGKAWIRNYWNWVQQYGAEVAFELLMREPEHPDDLCNVSFIRSWCLQYGIGCEANRDESFKWLARAIPYPNDRYWPLKDDWYAMVYDNDFRGLGWET